VDDDVIIIDLMKALLTIEGHQPIMVISARGDQGSKERAMRAGAKAFLTKPFGVEELTQYSSDLTHT
jgi:CheY-like chemotaxis protein